MKNKPRFSNFESGIIVIFIYLLILCSLLLIFNKKDELKCVDGDTFVINNRYYRLSNIDTPEKGESKYKEASEFTCNYIKYGNEDVHLDANGLDIYHRILVDVSKPYYGTETLNEKLIADCLAEPFYGKTTDKIIKLYNKNCKN